MCRINTTTICGYRFRLRSAFSFFPINFSPFFHFKEGKPLRGRAEKSNYEARFVYNFRLVTEALLSFRNGCNKSNFKILRKVSNHKNTIKWFSSSSSSFRRGEKEKSGWFEKEPRQENKRTMWGEDNVFWKILNLITFIFIC